MQHFFRYAALVFLVAAGAQPVFAQVSKTWTYRGTMTWDHPDGRRFSAAVADTRYNDDSLSILRNRNDNRWYIVFTYCRDVRFGTGIPYFFIQTKPPSAPAAERKRLHLEGETRIFQRRDRKTKYIVAQLTKTDRALLRQRSGNYIGVAYSLAGSTGSSSSRTYVFYGAGLSRVLSRISRPRQPSKPAAAFNTSSSSSSRNQVLINKMHAYRLPPTKCTRPKLAGYQTERGYNRLVSRMKRYVKCILPDIDRQFAAFRGFIRSLGGTVTKVGKNHRYRLKCNSACRVVFSETLDKHIDDMNARKRANLAYIERARRRLVRARRDLERRDRRRAYREEQQRQQASRPYYVPSAPQPSQPQGGQYIRRPITIMPGLQ